MAPKVKGWARTLELPYRIDYNSTFGNYNRALGLGESGIIISKELNPDVSDFATREQKENRWTGRWEVTLRWYVYPTGQKYKLLNTFATKQSAVDHAVKFMKAHPMGSR